MVTIGNEEVEKGNLAVRIRGERETTSLTLEQFKEKIQNELDLFI